MRVKRILVCTGVDKGVKGCLQGWPELNAYTWCIYGIFGRNKIIL
jgi:hypothetical protein